MLRRHFRMLLAALLITLVAVLRLVFLRSGGMRFNLQRQQVYGRCHGAHRLAVSRQPAVVRMRSCPLLGLMPGRQSPHFQVQLLHLKLRCGRWHKPVRRPRRHRCQVFYLWSVPCTEAFLAEMTAMVIKTADMDFLGLEAIVKQKEAELVRAFRKRDGITIGMRAHQIHERELQIKGRIHDRPDI